MAINRTRSIEARTRGTSRWPFIIVGLLGAHVGGMVYAVCFINHRTRSLGVVDDYYTQAVKWDEHRATVQTVLDELGAGDKPRLVAFNKADLVDVAARDGQTPAPALAGSVFVSALTGYGLDTLRAEIAALLASLWIDIDLQVPYAAGELLARVRERGTVELEYGERDVHVRGRMAPALAGELRAVAEAWAASQDAGNGSNGSGVPSAAATQSH